MKKTFFNVMMIVALMLSTVACSKEEPEGNVTAEIDLISYLSENMVYIEGGTFLMGAQKNDSETSNYDPEALNDESPVNAVTLSSFYMGKYEVTQALWVYVMNYSGHAADGSSMSAVENGPWLGDNPSSTYGVGDNYPAYYISYDDIVNYFLPRLNKITGENYRLPTEAEWEYTAHGGQQDEYTRTQGASGTYYKYSGSNTPHDVAWYSSNSNYIQPEQHTPWYYVSSHSSNSNYTVHSTAHSVGSKSPNALGLYDMSGNVSEWCSDWYDSYSSTSSNTDPIGPTSGSYRIYRGGSWDEGTFDCRVSYRYHGATPSNRSRNLGFRLALGLQNSQDDENRE